MSIKPLPRNVRYIERDGKTETKGKVIKVVSVVESFKHGDFQKEAQLIEWNNGSRSIRFGYYVKDHGAPKNKYQWGSQTTLILSIKNAEGFLRNALKLIKAKPKPQNRRRLTSRSS